MEFRKTPAGERGDPPQPCALCLMAVEDDLYHGKFYVLGDLFVHYYCLLFACALEQKGDDDQGILGFLEEDIRKEARRGKKLKCVYCSKNSATIGCVLGSCRKQFHRPCGVQNGALFQFFGQFKSYCCDHRPVQTFGLPTAPKKGKGKGKAATQETVVVIPVDEEPDCPICYDSITPQVSNNVLWAPCCQKRAWFHRECVQRMALSAGYHFRCPLCNDKKVFKNEMKEFGIYIPDQDAAWELVPNPYHELYERYCKCDAGKCLCAKGRDHDGRSGRWGIVLCDYCGSRGTHVACSSLRSVDSNWVCPICATQAKDNKLEKLPKTAVVPQVVTVRDDSDSGDEIDVMPTPQNKLSKVVGSMFRGESSKVIKTKTTARKSTTKNGLHLSPPKPEEKPNEEPGSGPSHSGRRLVKLLSSYKVDVSYLVQSIQRSNIELPSSAGKKGTEKEKIPEPSLEETKERLNVLKDNNISMEAVRKVKPAPLSVKKKLLEKVVAPNVTPPPSNRANLSRNVARRGGLRGVGRSNFRAGSRGSSSECSSLSSTSPSPPPKVSEEIRVRVGPDGRILNLVFPSAEASPEKEKEGVERLQYKPGPKSKKHLLENRVKQQSVHSPSPENTKPQELKLQINKPCPKSKKLPIISTVTEPPPKKSKRSRWDIPPAKYDPPSVKTVVPSTDEPEIIEVKDFVSLSRLRTIGAIAMHEKDGALTQRNLTTSSQSSSDSLTMFCSGQAPLNSRDSPICLSQLSKSTTSSVESLNRFGFSSEKSDVSPEIVTRLNHKTDDFKQRLSRSIANLQAQQSNVTPVSSKTSSDRKFENEKPPVNKLWDSFENGHGSLLPTDLKRTESSGSSTKSIILSSRKPIRRK